MNTFGLLVDYRHILETCPSHKANHCPARVEEWPLMPFRSQEINWLVTISLSSVLRLDTYCRKGSQLGADDSHKANGVRVPGRDPVVVHEDAAKSFDAAEHTLDSAPLR